MKGMNSMEDIEVLLDRAATQIRSSEPDPKLAAEAAARVWAHLGSESAAASAGAAEIEEIRGCEDYQALIPAYLAGSLPEARRLLLEDHSRECVPCRRALKEAREGKPVARPRSPRRARLFSFPKPVLRFALAAVLLAGLGTALYFISGLVLYGGPTATVQTVDGQLFRVTETAHLPVAAGDEVRRGEVLRTGREGGAVLRLRDGSLVEMRERSELSVREGHRGTTIQLGRGNVIVQAAKQHNRHLYVATDDCEVAVKGTIFSVNHGMKGSRVSVIEGEVRVVHDGQETALLPGEQIATNPYLDRIPVEREIGWSRDVDSYIALLKEYRALRREIDQRVPPKDERHDTRLLDLMPENTVFYAALPNLSDTITETHRVIREQVATNPVLQQWWNEQRKALPIEPMIDEVVEKIGHFGDYLGEEVAIGAQSGSGAQGEDFSGPLVLAEIVDSPGFRDFVENELDQSGVTSGNVAFLEDPFAPAPEADVYLWLHDDLVVGSPHVEPIRKVASFVLQGAVNPFVGTDFHQRIAELYAEGVEILVAADLENVISTALAHDAEGQNSEVLARLGVLEAQHLMLEEKHLGKVQHRAVLTFNNTRKGLASWLAEPAPMGALDFVSGDAKLVAAVVLKDPEAMMEDISSFSHGRDGTIDMEQVTSEFKNRLGLDLKDFIDVLGGELAFAIDGPLLPVPSWKLIVEVYDPARFQFTVEQAVAELNQHLLENGNEAIEISEEVVGGRTYYSFPVRPGIEVHYTYVEGYLIAAPSRALIDRAIRYRQSGYSITESARFKSLLPVDGQNNFSALVFQDLTSLVREAAQQLGQGLLTPEQEQEIDALTAEARPTLGYAYAEDRRIIAAAQSDNDAVSALVQRLLGLENPMGFAKILSELPIGL